MDSLRGLAHPTRPSTRLRRSSYRPATEILMGTPHFAYTRVQLVGCAKSVEDMALTVKGWELKADDYDVIIRGGGGKEEDRVNWLSLLRLFLLRKTCDPSWKLVPARVGDTYCADAPHSFVYDGYLVQECDSRAEDAVDFVRMFPRSTEHRRTIIVY